MTERHRASILKWARLYNDQCLIGYSGAITSNPTDGERARLTVATLRRICAGDTVADSLEWFRAEWKEFQAIQNARVNAADKVQRGGSSGLSTIGHLYATDSAGEQAELNIILACREPELS